MPNTRLDASRTTANASGKISSNVSPLANLSLNSSVLARKEVSLKDNKDGSSPLISSTMDRIRLISFAFLLPNSFCIKPNKYLNSLNMESISIKYYVSRLL